MQNKRKSAAGVGTVRKKVVIRNGKTYQYWEARYTTGFDLGTGKQVQKSITGKTQKEVVKKLTAATASIDAGTYVEPSKQTLGNWLDTWTATYLGNIKPRTLSIYESDIRVHIKPALGAVRLENLTTQMIQKFYNTLRSPTKTNPDGLSPKTIKNIHGVMHKALHQAVQVGLMRNNPSEACVLPRVERKNITPLDETEISEFLKVIAGNRFETLFKVTLFTGMREGEVCGLTWDTVDFNKGIIIINKQLQLHQEKGIEPYKLVSTKNGRSRVITPAPSVMKLLEKHKESQNAQKLRADPIWEDTNLVFTNEVGQHLTKSMLYREFKKVAGAIGRPDARFHDLRHSYAVAALCAGDDVKTVQENLGHATASFTLDVYGHVTNQMHTASAQRMEKFIENVTST